MLLLAVNRSAYDDMRIKARLPDNVETLVFRYHLRSTSNLVFYRLLPFKVPRVGLSLMHICPPLRPWYLLSKRSDIL